MTETHNADHWQNNSTLRATLLACLETTPPISLKGLALIEHPSSLSSANREDVRDAVVELIAYTNRCAKAIENLRDLPPIPFTHIITVEWML